MAGILSKSLRISAWSLAGLLGLLILAYLVLVAINWRDRPPTAEAQRMDALLDDRPPVSDADNAFVYLLGFSVPEGVDVVQMGAQRRDWILAVNRDAKQIDFPPDIKDEETSKVAEQIKQSFRERCRGDARGCEELLDVYAEDPGFTAFEQRRLQRYRELLKRRTWNETVPTDVRLPLPAFSNVMHGQELYFRELRSQARPGAAADIRARLDEDLEFWRGVQKSSGILISKMIAVAAIRQHYQFGNMVIRELPRDEQLAAVPDGWRREISPDELSMHLVMAGELRFSRGALREWESLASWQLGLESDVMSTGPLERASAMLLRPLYQPQDQHNHLAARYLAFADRFRVPLQRYEAVTEEARNDAPRELEWRLYNLTGWIIRNISGEWNFADYAFRVASIEPMRRAALLTVELRARGVPAAQMPDALREAELRNPFDLQAFHWSEAEQSVIHEGTENSSVKRHVYLY